jgi:putative sugar O-methyltransferase
MKVINFALISYNLFVDSFFRLIRLISVKFGGKKKILDSKLSDSQKLDYESLVFNLSENKKSLFRFRRNFYFRMILEHVNFNQGLDYYARIKELNVVQNEQISSLASTDVFGKPRRYFYKNLGLVSPTLLRYVSVYSEIETLIGFKNVNSVVEIGVGYGGQARVIENFTNIQKYAFYDLNSVQTLAGKFLSNTGSSLVPIRCDIDNVILEKFDLVISNYAISELPSTIQNLYIQNLITPAKFCYMIMNSGASNFTNRSSGKLSQLEFLSKVPGLKVVQEVPKTGPDNYVFYK